MWLGMLSSIGAQVPGFPATVPNALAAPLLAYIAAVASWCGRPSWACLTVELGLRGLLVSYLTLGAAAIALPALLRRRRIAAFRRAGSPGRGRCNVFPPSQGRKALRWRRGPAAVVAALMLAIALAYLGANAGEPSTPLTAGLRIDVLDVGQGDAILLRPVGGPAVLIDGGPPGDGLLAKLEEVGVDALGVALLTHEQSDHAGGIEELFERHFSIGRLLYARLGRRLRGAAAAAGAGPERIAAGDSLRVGRLRLSVLWPPPELLDQPLGGTDPNSQALVLLARWRWFSILLTADAEAGEVPIDPGPVDVLKVAHHGSEDSGLEALLDQTSPRLAVISVGVDNPYGHPAASTLAELAQHGVRTLRTDRRGTIELDVDRKSFVVRAGG
jgi:competence protein ComEC